MIWIPIIYILIGIIACVVLMREGFHLGTALVIIVFWPVLALASFGGDG